ncbi:hypothetical protein CORC01_14469 [Colletotrichum orchidophilum]|uniref:Uncharacterized protein n=1 Tax=Colletotrichum orchidophilum TaxID=1209926 RepID=A0A1G4AMC1_9PEZI|nr:uncharacterized protein CORC01_14469 [Colletotrichum orchidophilum]OHE90235.1 hypothetical protein CORC01_14469 [Colletotrichum orchidophilum]
MRTQYVLVLEHKKITSLSESWPGGDVVVVADATAIGNASAVDADVHHAPGLEPRNITSSPRPSPEVNAVVLVADTISIDEVSVVCDAC